MPMIVWYVILEHSVINLVRVLNRTLHFTLSNFDDIPLTLDYHDVFLLVLQCNF